MEKEITVIGAGFAGLSAAAYLAKEGYKVRVFEKNEGPGGRCSQFSAAGFTFDMGPSWYWMPDVFDKFFADFGKKTSDYYQLHRLDPGYQIFFDLNDVFEVPANPKELGDLFEKIEPGAAKALEEFLNDAAYKYERGINDLVYRPSRKLSEFLDFKLLKDLSRLQIFGSYRKLVQRYFKAEKIRRIMEFPIYFLGALPENTPAMYSLMNYADLSLGTWYPMGGMYEIAKGMESLAKELGVVFHYNEPISKILVENSKVRALQTEKAEYRTDAIIGSADYHHIEQNLLEKKYRNYKPDYWESRTMAPSCLIFFLGINKKIKKLQHHNLFFDRSFEQFGKEIYTEPQWPSDPLFYVCAPSVTDSSVAPEGCENLFVLIPVAPGLEDLSSYRNHYYDIVMKRLELYTGENIRDALVFRQSFAHKDFISRYHSFKGNAYGLANTLFQTAIFKPRLDNKKLSNMYYSGQLTVPGPGVPPSLISGKVVAGELMAEWPLLKKQTPKTTKI